MRSRVRLAFVIACTSLLPGGCAVQEGKELAGTSTSSTGGGSAGESGSGSTGLLAGCGDGAVVAPEACDDGNTLDGDACNSDCQISGSLAWCKAEIGDGSNNIGLAVATDSAGNAIIVGHANDMGLDGDAAIVIKYAGDGSLLWTRTLTGELYAVGVVAHADDSIVVATETRLFALTAAGEITYSGPSNEAFVFQDNGLGISAQGKIAFAANICGLEPRGVVGALHDDLTVAWSREVNDLAASTQSWAIVADLAGSWLLGGTVVVDTIDQGDAGIREITEGFLRKYDADG